ncbi:alpha/beta fold hydrolase [Winogradskya consettensis]|uniref:Hydrolase n=1 Tax=Winogradskya consettensis TaxID=113560 RepID=A0A919VZH4_9ACTN|nr:alpha/beta hydrolase [Actinoplanes consettensis]GIM85294.1 hydrolase [Actinoplanes consettensis]
MNSVSTHEFVVDGVRQVYHVAGSGPVCVAHSGGPGLLWAYLRSPELERHFTMVYVEPVGTGESGRLPDGGYSLAIYVQFLAALIDQLGVERVYLLGHSAGGFVAQTYALEHPDRVAGLILYSTSPQAGPEFWAAAMDGLVAYPQRHPDIAEAAAVPSTFQQAQAAPDDDSLSQLFAAAVPVYFADFWSRRAEFAAWQAGIRMWRGSAFAQDPVTFDVEERLGELTMPTVVIAGRHDFICGLTWAERLVKSIPGAQLHVLENSGHFGHVEEPAAFASAAAVLKQLR